MNITKKNLYFALSTATVLWGIMFSPLTAPHLPFWPLMSLSAVILLGMAFYFRRDWPEILRFSPRMFLFGTALAIFLWGVFWLGDKMSALLLDFAPGQVGNVYLLKEGISPSLIGFLLLVLIGPAEEIFWRGYVQRTFSELYGSNKGAILCVIAYTSVHVFSLNFMLLAAAGVLGIVWSAIFRFRPKGLPALIVSHALWDVAVFVLFPFR